jgi:3',5'-cyclic AMP phosphodiesterase CpdA
MRFEIVHLSDLHFGNPSAHLRRTDGAEVLGPLLQGRLMPSYVVISGDITFQGLKSGYAEALEAIRPPLAAARIPMKNIVVCPGNHDVVREDAERPMFKTFDEWSSSLRGDKECTFAKNPVRILQTEAADFLLINTAHHGLWGYGLVNAMELKRITKQLIKTPHRPRIAVLHHHLVPVVEDDTSTTRNAYEVLEVLQEHDFTMILHGHQHAILSLAVGTHKMQISAVGSFGYGTPGVINSGAVYTFDGATVERVDRFGITLDVSARLLWLKPAHGGAW